MTKHVNASLIVTVLAGLFFTLSVQTANAADYSSIRGQASGGSSEVLNAFLSASQDGSTVRTEPVAPNDQVYDDLMQKYRAASVHDPVGDLLTLYPIASHERIVEFKSMNPSDVAQLLADDPPEQRIIALIVARSPSIAQAENAWRATLNRYPQTLFLQDLLNRYQSFTSGLSVGVGEEYQNGMIQMNYPSPGMLSLRGRVVEIDAEIAYRDFLREASETVADAKVLLAQIRNKDELISSTSTSLSLLSILGQVAQVQYEAGTRSFSDLVRIQTEQARRRDQIQRLGSEREGLLGQLAASISLPANTSFGEIGWSEDSKPSLDDNALRDELPRSRQEIIQAALGLEKMDAMIQMTRRQAIPDATLGMSYLQAGGASSDISGATDSAMPEASVTSSGSGSTDTSMSGMDSGTAGGTGAAGADMTATENMNMNNSDFMNTPMVDYRRSSFGIDYAWAAELVDRRAEMASMLQNMTDMALGMLEMQINRYNQGLQSEATYSGRVIPDARAALDVVRIGYSGDENTFSDLIGAELALLDARNDLANIRMDRRIAFAEIERQMGKDIPASR